MKISVTFQNDVLEIQKKGDGLQAEIWQKKLEDFEFKKNISTGMTVENKKLRKILFWKPIEDNILMVYTRTGEIKACYAPSRGAYLRVLERICNVQHISLTKAGLSLQLQVGVVSDKELSFGEAALVIGAGMIVSAFAALPFPEAERRFLARPSLPYRAAAKVLTPAMKEKIRKILK